MIEPVIIEDYDPRWPERFETLHARIGGALGPLAAAIEHVGSTAVPGLASKPIIDIDVLLQSRTDVQSAIERLAAIGYAYQGDLGIAGRGAFRAPASEFRHHLYVCPSNSQVYRQHLAFRDYLRIHPEDVCAYGLLKRSLASRYGSDRDGYTQAKTEFIEAILKRAEGSGSEHFSSAARIIS